MDERREYYRVRFPTKERPTLYFAGDSYEVLDFSERGLCTCTAIPGMRIGDEVAGEIQFKDGDRFAIEGEVARVLDGQVAFCLNKRQIPYAKILDEQRRIMKLYPFWQP
jgi:hypothetical protein